MSLLATHPLSVDSLVKIMKEGPGTKMSGERKPIKASKMNKKAKKTTAKKKPKKSSAKTMKIKKIKTKKTISKRKDIFS